MNVFESLAFLSDLRRGGGPFLLMPDGLWIGERRLAASRWPAALLLRRWSCGDLLERTKIPSWRALGDGALEAFFRRDETRPPPEIPAPTGPVPTDLTWEEALRRIEGFAAVGARKGRYERFLETMVVTAFMESLKNSKVTLGGVWTSESSDPTVRRGRGFEVFVRNVGERNAALERLKEIAEGLPQVQIEEAALFRPPGPRPWVSEYARYLERFWAIVELRNALQRLHLMLPYASETERQTYRKRVEEARRLLRSYLAADEAAKGI